MVNTVSMDTRLVLGITVQPDVGFAVNKKVSSTDSIPVTTVRYAMEGYTVLPQISTVLPQVLADHRGTVTLRGTLTAPKSFAALTPEVGDLWLIEDPLPWDSPALDSTPAQAGDGVMWGGKEFGWSNIGPVMSGPVNTATPKVVSEALYPRSVTVEFYVGKGTYQPADDVSPTSQAFACDARFLPQDATMGAELLWPARYGERPFTLVSPPGNCPVVLPDNAYSFYPYNSRDWVDNPAVQFNGAEMAVSDGGAWLYSATSGDRLPDTGFGMVAVWSLYNSATVEDTPIMGFIGSGFDVGLYLDRNDILLLKNSTDQGSVGISTGIAMKSDWFDRPVMLVLAHFPGRKDNFIIGVKSGGSNPLLWGYSSDIRGQQLWSGGLGLMWGNSELSCELLDLAVWRDGITTQQISDAAAAYTKIYGV